MKKILLIIFVASTFFIGCRMTKDLQIWQAQSSAHESEQSFVNHKLNEVSLLKLTEIQKKECEIIWRNEKFQLALINIREEKEIAPIIYKSEIEFRKILTSDQLTLHKHLIGNQTGGYFLSDRTMGELKRIYNL